MDPQESANSSDPLAVFEGHMVTIEGVEDLTVVHIEDFKSDLPMPEWVEPVDPDQPPQIEGEDSAE